MVIRNEDWKELSLNYINSVREILESGNHVRIPNPDLNHAKLLIYALFEKARNSIKIFSENLSAELYGDERILRVLNSLNNVNVEIIVEDNPESHIEGVDINKLEDCEDVKKIPGHFIVVDGISYRFEKPHTIGDSKDVRGTADFNDRKISEEMEFAFDNILKPHSRPIV